MAGIAAAVLGLFVGLWMGMLLGMLHSWSKKTFAVLFVGMSVFVVGYVILSGDPGGTAQSFNWWYVAGTLPGYIVGFPSGECVYEDVWGDDGE